MEIKNYTSAVNAYRFAAESMPKKTDKAVSASKSNTDKADFSSAARASFADSLKAAARTSADSSASPERIKALSEAVANGTYSVSAQDVASSILGF